MLFRLSPESGEFAIERFGFSQGFLPILRNFSCSGKDFIANSPPSGQCGGHVLGDSDSSTPGTALEEGANRDTLTSLRGASDGRGNGCATLSPSVMHRKKTMEKESSYGTNQRV